MEFMPYADDSIWLLFGLGLAIIAGDVIALAVFRINAWTFLGFLVTGILMSISYYVVGRHSPIDSRNQVGRTKEW
jgi:hypothetical protein